MTDFDDAPGASVDNILREERGKLINDLAAVLDVEAGLREVMIAARHTNLVRDLREVLDIDAGLSAIVPAAPVPSRPGTEMAASVASAAAAETPRRETAHVRGNPFNASSWRRLWKRLRQKQQRSAVPDQAAALIEMRLLTRTLAGYFTNLTDRADDLAADMKRANKECQNMVTPVLARKQQYPSYYALEDTEKALQQVVVDAGGITLDLEGPCELASKLAATARVAKDRSLVRAGTELAAILTGCRESARTTWSSLNDARAVTAWLAAMGGGIFLEPGKIQDHVARIHNRTLLAMEQQAGLAEALKTAADRNPARYLESIEIDASGADLSDADVPDIDILDLVIWTHETTWPLAMEDQVVNHSREIREGVYQVHSGGRTRRMSVDV